VISVEQQIQAMVDVETAAWNAQDAEALVSLFHPDMVWPRLQNLHKSRRALVVLFPNRPAGL
jgi:uncharacterized protein (TIGR02246 family)